MEKSLTNKEEILLAALKDIMEFGKKHSGYGYTCSKKAEKAIEQINSIKE